MLECAMQVLWAGQAPSSEEKLGCQDLSMNALFLPRSPLLLRAKQDTFGGNLLGRRGIAQQAKRDRKSESKATPGEPDEAPSPGQAIYIWGTSSWVEAKRVLVITSSWGPHITLRTIHQSTSNVCKLSIQHPASNSQQSRTQVSAPRSAQFLSLERGSGLLGCCWRLESVAAFPRAVALQHSCV